VKISAVEYRALCQLAGEPTRVFTREELLRQIGSERFVRNVWGVGYCLIDGTNCI